MKKPFKAYVERCNEITVLVFHHFFMKYMYTHKAFILLIENKRNIFDFFLTTQKIFFIEVHQNLMML